MSANSKMVNLEDFANLLNDDHTFYLCNECLYILESSIGFQVLLPVVNIIYDDTDIRSIILRNEEAIRLPKDKSLITQHFIRDLNL